MYNNAAQTAGDDLFTFGANSMISLADATKMSGDRKLASDGEKLQVGSMTAIRMVGVLVGEQKQRMVKNISMPM